MTVRELIELLQNENQDRIVIMAKDAEGNGYSPLRSAWTGSYRAESPYSGEVGLEQLTAQDKLSGYTEEDVIDGEAALIFSPVN